MFDFSFGELTVCLLVALIVLGPEKLHGVIRSVGRWTGQAKSYMRNLTAELERETQAGEIKRQLQDTQRMLREQADELKSGVDDFKTDLRKQADELKSDVGNIQRDVKDAIKPSTNMPKDSDSDDSVLTSDKENRGK